MLSNRQRRVAASYAIFTITSLLRLLEKQSTARGRLLVAEPNRYAPARPDGIDQTCNPHVVFTTFMCPDSPGCSPLRQRIENNTHHVWSSMGDIEFKEIPPSSVKCNSFGMPILGEMYKHMFDHCPDARTYTYINGDLISTHDNFVATVNHLFPDRYTKLGEFLMVGRRTNVPWSEEYDASNEDFDFKKHFHSGEMMNHNAIDYFTITKGAFDWENIPKFVVGRSAYDQWLLEHIWGQSWGIDKNKIYPYVEMVDATGTVQMIHQSVASGWKGKYTWGGDAAKDPNDEYYNFNLAKDGNRLRRFAHGHTDNAFWETSWDENEHIRVRHKFLNIVW